jgi:PadR family transcriptional regulator PadR
MKVQGLLENTTQQMRKGILELCILSIISDEREAYPSDIIRRLEESQMIVVQGTLYPLLARLKGAGLLEYTWKESDAGPPRKYYALTDSGHEFLDGLLDTWAQLVDAVKHSTKSITANQKGK